MKAILTRLGGYALVAASILGLMFSIAGLVVVWRVERQLTAAALTNFDLLGRALGVTADGLVVADSSLKQASTTLDSIESTTSGAARAIEDTIPVIDTVGTLVGKDLPKTVASTQQALDSAGTSAKLVDDTLGFLNSIPFFTGSYNPDVPLHISIAKVSESLDTLPASLSKVQVGLNTTAKNLKVIQTNVDTLAENISQIDKSVTEAQTVVGQYQDVVGDLRAQVTAIRTGLPGWLQSLSWGISLILIWLGIAQIGLFTQGLELIGRSRAK